MSVNVQNNTFNTQDNPIGSQNIHDGRDTMLKIGKFSDDQDLSKDFEESKDQIMTEFSYT